jgi:hypothetical protein
MNAALRTVGAVAVVCVLCLVMSGCSGGGLTKATFDSIKNGMTQAEVEKVIGSKGQDLAGDAAKALTKGMGDMGKTVGDAAGGDAGKALGDAGKLMGGLMDAMTGIQKVVRWGDDNKYIVVVFMGDKVVGKDSKGL